MTLHATVSYDELVCTRCGRKIATVGGIVTRPCGAATMLLCKDCDGMIHNAEAWATAHPNAPLYIGAAAKFVNTVAQRIKQCGDHLRCA